jgi:hypothetical protein
MLDFDEIHHYTLIYTYDSTRFSRRAVALEAGVAQP